MVPCVRVEQAADHPLVLGAMFRGLTLEELDTASRERNGHLDAYLAKRKFLRGGEEIRNDLQSSEGFVRVSDFRAHRLACPVASNLHQRSVSGLHGR